MLNLKSKIKSRLNETIVSEKIVTPDELKKNTDDLVKTAKDSLGIDDDQAKDYVSGFIGETESDEVNPETFHTEGELDSVSRGIQYGMNPEVEADKYEEYRALMQQLALEKDDETSIDKPIKEDNDPVKLKADVSKLMAKLDLSSIAPYLEKIDNPTEQAEVIAQFAEKIGVPKAKLSSVIAQLKMVAETTKTNITKSELIEAVIGKKPRQVIKTVKVKDIK
jgi:hypothetical protein